MASVVEDTDASHQEISIPTLKQKKGNQITFQSDFDFDAVLYKLRGFFVDFYSEHNCFFNYLCSVL